MDMRVSVIHEQTRCVVNARLQVGAEGPPEAISGSREESQGVHKMCGFLHPKAWGPGLGACPKMPRCSCLCCSEEARQNRDPLVLTPLSQEGAQAGAGWGQWEGDGGSKEGRGPAREEART